MKGPPQRHDDVILEGGKLEVNKVTLKLKLEKWKKKKQ